MERIVYGEYSSVISRAFKIIDPPIANLLRYTHFFTGTDPIYAGLHNFKDIPDGRSYRNTAHVAYPWHMIDKITTVIIPGIDGDLLYTVVHELGHVLDEILRFEHLTEPINEYAATNRMEAFAEAFAAQYIYPGEKAEDILQRDKATQVLFSRLRGKGNG